MEVIVATAVAAAVLISAATLVQGYLRDTVYLNKKLAADLAAKNLLDQFLIPYDPQYKYRPSTISTGTVQQGPYTFNYSQSLKNTSTKGLREVTLTIYEDESKKPLRTLTLFADTQ